MIEFTCSGWLNCKVHPQLSTLLVVPLLNTAITLIPFLFPGVPGFGKPGEFLPSFPSLRGVENGPAAGDLGSLSLSGGGNSQKKIMKRWFGLRNSPADAWGSPGSLRGKEGPFLVTLLAPECSEENFKQVEVTWHGDFMANPSPGPKVGCVGGIFLKWDLLAGKGSAPNCRSPRALLHRCLAPQPEPTLSPALIQLRGHQINP